MSEPTGAHVSARWAEWRRRVSLDEYFRRWDDMAQRGEATHGEADFIEALSPRSVLDAGCGMGRVAIELDRRGIEVHGVDLDDDLLHYARLSAPHLTWHHADLAAMDLGRSFHVVAMPGNVMIFCRDDVRGAIVDRAAAHLQHGGLLIAGFSLDRRPDALTLDEYDSLCVDSGLQLVDRFATWERDPYAGHDYAVSVHRLER